jgi:hypothetical protein
MVKLYPKYIKDSYIITTGLNGDEMPQQYVSLSQWPAVTDSHYNNKLQVEYDTY